jgi:hypothetical protein
MENNFAQLPEPQSPQPRRFVYRAVHADAHPAHPMRRSTDVPRPFLGNTAPLSPRLLLLRMCIYLKST